MKHTIVAATQNKHKIVEIEAITKEFGMDIISRDEAGVPDIEVNLCRIKNAADNECAKRIKWSNDLESPDPSKNPY